MGQIQFLDIRAKSLEEIKIIDSIGYGKSHSNTKLLFSEIEGLKNNLQKIGYVNMEVNQLKKKNDSTFLFEIILKNQIKYIDTYIGTNQDLKTAGLSDLNVKIIKIPFRESENFLSKLSNRLEDKGFSQAKVQFINIVQNNKNNNITAELKVTLGTKRSINDLIIVGYDNFPQGIKENIINQFKNKSFTTANLLKLKNAFDAFNFISQNKFPEILFMEDTTKVYIYLQKTKANRFDGLIGFGNNENSAVRFNGYLDLLLINSINAGEKFNLSWKSDGNKQTNFNVGIEIPYIFKTKLLLKSQLIIFKQDSLFQNTKLIADLGYLLNFNTKLFVGLQSTESTNIQNNLNKISSLDTQFTTLQIDYLKPKDRDNPYFYLFPEQTKVNLKAGFGNRKSILGITNQNFVGLETLHNINFTDKISINIRSQNFILISKNYFTNELYRFGGINSVRGFNENSLQSNAYVSAMSEFRYAVTPSLYVFTVADYGFYEDKTTNNQGNIGGFGAGFGLLTKTGLLQFVYANGQQSSTGNSIVHLSFRVGF